MSISGREAVGVQGDGGSAAQGRGRLPWLSSLSQDALKKTPSLCWTGRAPSRNQTVPNTDGIDIPTAAPAASAGARPAPRPGADLKCHLGSNPRASGGLNCSFHIQSTP